MVLMYMRLLQGRRKLSLCVVRRLLWWFARAMLSFLLRLLERLLLGLFELVVLCLVVWLKVWLLVGRLV